MLLSRGSELTVSFWVFYLCSHLQKRFAVHGVSVNNTNKLINGDNKGYAAYLTEKWFNGKNSLSGQGPFVAAFAQSNEGDVSPNTLGAYCTGTDIPCDGTRNFKCPNGSSCAGR